MTDGAFRSGTGQVYGGPVQHIGQGIALRIGAVTMFGAMMAAFKYAATHGVSPVEILFYRNIFALPTIIIWVLMTGGFAIVRTQTPMAHVTRSAIGLVVMACTSLPCPCCLWRRPRSSAFPRPCSRRCCLP